MFFLAIIAQKMDPTSSPMHLCLTQCSVISITCLLQMRNGQARYELYLTYIESCLGHRTDRNGLDTRMESNLLTFSNRSSGLEYSVLVCTRRSRDNFEKHCAIDEKLLKSHREKNQSTCKTLPSCLYTIHLRLRWGPNYCGEG